MKTTTEPFKVTCKLLDGRVNSTDGHFSLDSILYHAWYLKNAAQVFDGTGDDTKIKYVGLPLRQLDNNRYSASWGFYHQYGQNIEYWNKRTDHITFGELNTAKGTINTSSGEYKAYHMPQLIRLISDIEFYGYGTIEGVKTLLSYIPAIGKKNSAGWGIVKEWVVEPFEEDWSTNGKYGLMRPMPIEECTPDRNYIVAQTAIRPPGWKHTNQTVCFVPEVRI